MVVIGDPGLTASPGQQIAAVLSPDGRKLAFRSGQDLYVVTVRNDRPTVTRASVTNVSMSCSPTQID
jgi:hypothetical protein